MNNCILSGKIIRRPELRYTQDNQTPYAQMVIEFDALRNEDNPGTMKAVAWGNLAKEVAEHYGENDRVIVEGRLSMMKIDRPEGFKETRPELVISHIYQVSGDIKATVPGMEKSEKVVAMSNYKPKAVETAPKQPREDFAYESSYELSQPSSTPVKEEEEKDLDDIPF
ncbi:MAG: Single-stranded DNA-binding protein [Chroococcopsis gigantea SAG 12.99]|jgi:single-strand DNA-binding protein|nr:single-stranded DNA-binding protein [Chlorogloea purpurea SAG 13.99]MDV3000527.1 Single-stranded DNA-binding protein [Chroococcopsis gigantea SAG 12.99]